MFPQRVCSVWIKQSQSSLPYGLFSLTAEDIVNYYIVNIVHYLDRSKEKGSGYKVTSKYVDYSESVHLFTTLEGIFLFILYFPAIFCFTVLFQLVW